MTGTNKLRIGRAVNRLLFGSYYLGRAISGLLLRAGVSLDQLAKVSIVAEYERNVVRVATPAIGRDLEATTDSQTQLLEERPRVGSLGNVVSQDQLRVPIDRDEGPAISNVRSIVAAFLFGLFLAAHERPDFVTLNVSHFDAANDTRQQPTAVLANGQDQIADRVTVKVRDSLDRSDAHSFNEKVHSQNGTVHRDTHVAQGLYAGFCPSAGAITAFKPLVAVSVFAVFLG